MRVYAGAVGGERALAALRLHDVGRLVSPWGWKAPLRDVPWCFDNGAYRAHELGVPWDEERWATYAVYDDDALGQPRMLHQMYAVRRPDFAVCPDVPMDAEASLALSGDWIARVPTYIPWYLALQDGTSEQDVEDALAWGEEDGPGYRGLFVGGTSKWKFRTTPRWVGFAHERGLQLHVGRFSGLKRLTWCMLVGVDSVDSSAFETFVPAARVSLARAHARSQSRLDSEGEKWSSSFA